MLTVLNYVRDQSDSTLTLAQMAEIACQSPYHFERVFQAQTGITAVQHLRNVRLLRAAMRLRLTNEKIINIALDTGYANPESFSRAFRHKFDTAPRNYRKQHQQKGEQMPQPTIGLVKIPVTDFEAATAYYRETIGLEEEFAVEAYGWAQYKTGNLPLCLYVVGMGGGDGTPGHEVGFHLKVDDAQTFYDAIKTRGGQFASEIVESNDGGKFFLLQDPDGNTFKVIQHG